MSTMISSHTIGILRSGMKGCLTNLPWRCLYRESLGWTATAVSPSMVSGRVVATMIFSSEFSMGYANDVITPNMTGLSYPGTLSHFLPVHSILSSSRLESVVLSRTHQLTSRFARRMTPRSWKVQKDSITALDRDSFIVKATRDQSKLPPKQRICLVIRSWYL